MYRKMEDFLTAYKTLSDGTAKVFENLTEANLGQPVAEGHRTLGQIAWHIVVSVPEMMSHTGLTVSPINPEAPPPSSAEEIINGYKTVTVELQKLLKENWCDESLLQVDDMYGQQWPRGLTLSILMSHEIHHRGQMTVLLRQAGQKVPGTAGPSKEEWQQFGMEPPLY